MTEWLGRVPKPGETIERDGIRVEVLASDEMRVEQVRLSQMQPQHPSPWAPKNTKSKMTPHKSGFVSILGRPNAGKSTLLNALVGQKVAIVADKPQTTRTAIQGVLTTPEAQIIFIDTPGIHKSDSAINKRMMDAVRASLEERDLFIYLVDATKPFGSGDEKALSILRRTSDAMPPVIVALNKIDALPAKHELLPLLEEYQKRYKFEAICPSRRPPAKGSINCAMK